MDIKWIAVVTRTEARIFTSDKFTLITTLENELGRERNRALRYDKPGYQRGIVGTSGTYLTGEKDPHEDAAIEFARRVDEYLYEQLNLNRFDKLVVVAEPKMLGRLRSHMDKHLAVLTEWTAKDFGKLSVDELRKAVHV